MAVEQCSCLNEKLCAWPIFTEGPDNIFSANVKAQLQIILGAIKLTQKTPFSLNNLSPKTLSARFTK